MILESIGVGKWRDKHHENTMLRRQCGPEWSWTPHTSLPSVLLPKLRCSPDDTHGGGSQHRTAATATYRNGSVGSGSRLQTKNISLLCQFKNSLSRMGLQRGAIERFQPEGLDTSLKLLPEYLQEAGYSTHLVRRVWGGSWQTEHRLFAMTMYHVIL